LVGHGTSAEGGSKRESRAKTRGQFRNFESNRTSRELGRGIEGEKDGDIHEGSITEVAFINERQGGRRTGKFVA